MSRRDRLGLVAMIAFAAGFAQFPGARWILVIAGTLGLLIVGFWPRFKDGS